MLTEDDGGGPPAGYEARVGKDVETSGVVVSLITNSDDARSEVVKSVSNKPGVGEVSQTLQFKHMRSRRVRNRSSRVSRSESSLKPRQLDVDWRGRESEPGRKKARGARNVRCADNRDQE